MEMLVNIFFRAIEEKHIIFGYSFFFSLLYHSNIIIIIILTEKLSKNSEIEIKQNWSHRDLFALSGKTYILRCSLFFIFIFLSLLFYSFFLFFS